MSDLQSETRERRAASYLVGYYLGLDGKRPKHVTAAHWRKGYPLFQVACALHQGTGWSNPIQIWEMLEFADYLGFSKTEQPAEAR